MSTISSFFRLPAKSIAQEPHCVVRAMCEFTQCIDEQLFRWLGGRNVLEQPVPRFVPIDHELMGGVRGSQLLEGPVAEATLWQTPHARRSAVSGPVSSTNLESARAPGPLRGGWGLKAASRYPDPSLSGLPRHTPQGSLIQEGLN